MPDELPEKLLLTPKDVAHMLSLSEKTLEAWRAKGMGPPFVKLGSGGKTSAIRYPVDKLKAWLAEQS
ncbi:MAG: helix-turn-helix domain-containing protein [Phyllobacterium sp.]|uniref:helix-turn-helix transcriptional regulator n=1 Tax=Phyllobacterium sp. TaxID=1871046 RepID=UPI0030F22B66